MPPLVRRALRARRPVPSKVVLARRAACVLAATCAIVARRTALRAAGGDGIVVSRACSSGGKYDVVHHTDLLLGLVAEKQLVLGIEALLCALIWVAVERGY